MSARHVSVAALATSGLLALTGCGSGSTAATSPSGHHSGGMSMSGSTMQHMSASMIMIKNFAFTSPKSVKAGAEVMVTNDDGETHSVTADHGAFGVTVPAGKTVSFTAPMKPGTYGYHCTFHSNMHGSLVVR